MNACNNKSGGNLSVKKLDAQDYIDKLLNEKPANIQNNNFVNSLYDKIKISKAAGDVRP